MYLGLSLSYMTQDTIHVKGARTHNLKDIDVAMPRNNMIVFTGLSGSGKSSLAFDTIFAEGQRRYVESLSSYARQFIQQMQKPDVDEIDGLSPAISIDQSSRSNNPRSTVATITDIYDYMRVLYARVGTPHCLECSRPIERQSIDEIKEVIVDEIKKQISDHQEDTESVAIFAPTVRGRKGEYYQQLYDYLSAGYSTVLVDGETKNLREEILLDANKKHDIDLLVDSIDLTAFVDNMEDAEDRLAESLEETLNKADGLIRIVYTDGDEYSTKKEGRNELGNLYSSRFTCPHDGFSFPEVEPRLFSFNSPYGACDTCDGLGRKSRSSEAPCPKCGGARLSAASLNVLLEADGEKKNIFQLNEMPIDDAHAFVENVALTGTETEIAKTVLQEIISRLQFMMNVGIEYLTLNRRADTLSGGEAQRIRLASQLGSRLVGALYVLDEPTIGLHMKDNSRLINTLQDLRDIGNTIIVVEHDENTIFASDYLVDLGPGAGRHGGEVVVDGYLEDLLDDTDVGESITIDYLRNDTQIPTPAMRRNNQAGHLQIEGASKFNIDNLNLKIPLNRMIAITGVSGSGKSTLMHDIIYENAQSRLHRRGNAAEELQYCDEFTGTEYLGRTVMIDQSPIGRTSRSNPATYTGVWGPVRELFASTKEARVRGWGKGRFSFNTEGGRCESCSGKGEIKVEMHFLPTVYVTCDVCQGKRFTEETLEATYNGKNIYDILQMTVEEAKEFFEDIPKIHDRLETLDNVGLSYLKLGQPSTTLSGGEAQRVKISSELYRRHTKKTLYLLDEPTVGLHYEDIKKLINILQMLVDKGNTVMVIEHNMDVIKSADYIIDMGPNGGKEGGKIVTKGTPEQVAMADTATGEFLENHVEPED